MSQMKMTLVRKAFRGRAKQKTKIKKKSQQWHSVKWRKLVPRLRISISQKLSAQIWREDWVGMNWMTLIKWAVWLRFWETRITFRRSWRRYFWPCFYVMRLGARRRLRIMLAMPEMLTANWLTNSVYQIPVLYWNL